MPTTLTQEPLLVHVRHAIVAHRLFARGDRILIGVSGGIDSVALLHLLRELAPTWRLALHVAHLDHGLREESSEEATFVAELAARWNISATVERRPVDAICAREGWSLEEGARRVRYEFFLDVARRQSASCVALAHTADDQAETVLMRLLRGAGLLGLGAIPAKRALEGPIGIARPLLDVWRRELLAYIETEQLPYRSDPSNEETRFTRNRIRHELLPMIERDYNPNIRAALVQLAQQSASDYAYLQEAAGRVWKRVVKVSQPDRVVMRIAVFLSQPEALQRQLVRQAIQQVRGDLHQFEYRHWVEIRRLFCERPLGTLVHLPGRVQLRREPQHVVCEVASRTEAAASL